jgi:Carboxypeptidase regulatory-like domain
MKILFSAVVAVASWLFLPPAAAACTCASPSDPCLAIKAADVVFVGRAIGIESGSHEPPNLRPAMVRFDVAEILHGAVPNVVVLRDGGGASCVFGFRTGRDYVVYARYREGVLAAGLCSRTGELADRRHDVDILRERRRGTPVPRVAGRIVEGRQRVDGSLSAELLPLVGVSVTAQQGTAVRRTVTDADGRFVFMNIPAGDYRVTADLPRAYERVWGQDATVRVGCYGEVNIGVSRVPLHGTLVRGDGTPESWPVTIHAFAIDRSQRTPSKERSTFTYLAHDGTWSFDSLPPGEYVIGVGVHFKSRWDPVRMPFWYPAATRPEDAEIIRIGEIGVVQLSLRHPPPPREIQFSGVIVDQGGRPTNGGGVVLHDLDVDHGVASGSADARGRFQVRGWEGRRYTITAYHCQGRVPTMSEPVPVDPKSAEPLRIVLTRQCPARSP